MAEDDRSRREEELEALQAFYGEDIETFETEEESSSGLSWRIRIAPDVTLEIHPPIDYPSTSCPVPLVCTQPWILDDGRIEQLETEMIDMYSPDTEVAILWAEYVREAIAECTTDNNNTNTNPQSSDPVDSVTTSSCTNDGAVPTYDDNDDELPTSEAVVFIPPTTKYGQPVRHFDSAIIQDDSNCCSIYVGEPYHPPRSGPSEKFRAHVARVTSMEQVHWVRAALLLNDKNVARATHNMTAYRFYDRTTQRRCIVSDNDDDGEPASGKKIAALLDMANAIDVIVIVSRWYGGVHLGPARFKYIASVARDALEAAGFIDNNNSNKSNEKTAKSKR